MFFSIIAPNWMFPNTLTALDLQLCYIVTSITRRDRNLTLFRNSSRRRKRKAQQKETSPAKKPKFYLSEPSLLILPEKPKKVKLVNATDLIPEGSQSMTAEGMAKENELFWE